MRPAPPFVLPANLLLSSPIGYAFANNRFEGCSPSTIERLRALV